MTVPTDRDRANETRQRLRERIKANPDGSIVSEYRQLLAETQRARDRYRAALSDLHSRLSEQARDEKAADNGPGMELCYMLAAVARSALGPGGVAYIVQLEPGVWLAPGDGDPPRTLVKANAARYTSIRSASTALLGARMFRPFANATIEPPSEYCVCIGDGEEWIDGPFPTLGSARDCASETSGATVHEVERLDCVAYLPDVDDILDRINERVFDDGPGALVDGPVFELDDANQMKGAQAALEAWARKWVGCSQTPFAGRKIPDAVIEPTTKEDSQC